MKKFKVKSRLFSHKYKEILEKCRYTTRNVMCRKGFSTLLVWQSNHGGFIMNVKLVKMIM